MKSLHIPLISYFLGCPVYLQIGISLNPYFWNIVGFYRVRAFHHYLEKAMERWHRFGYDNVPWLSSDFLDFFMFYRFPWCGRNKFTYIIQDDVIKRKHFPRHWPFVRGIHRPPVNPHTKASDAELWYFLPFAPEPTVEQTKETPIIKTPLCSLWRRSNEQDSSMFLHFRIIHADLLLTPIDFNRSMDNYFHAL